MKKEILFFLILFGFFSKVFPFENTKNWILVDPFPAVEFQIEEEEEDQTLFDIQGAKKSDEETILEKAFILEQKLSEQIYGQEMAVKETSDAIIRFAAGVNDPNAPIASLLYSGPSGVGKTELAKRLTLELYGSFTRLTRINMAEYSEPHSVSRLIGSPPGYIGYEQGGQLTNALSKNPYSIVLLDEVEKAHPKVLKLFLQALDEGYITSATGKMVDCRKCIFILTSNLAACEIADLHTKGLTTDEIADVLKPYYMKELSPELFNRIDLILFAPLSPKVLESLINKMLKQLADRVQTSRKVRLQFDGSIIEFFMDFCLDPKLGARPLKRLIDKELATVIAKALIQGKCGKGDTLKCYYEDGYILVEKL